MSFWGFTFFHKISILKKREKKQRNLSLSASDVKVSLSIKGKKNRNLIIFDNNTVNYRYWVNFRDGCTNAQ